MTDKASHVYYYDGEVTLYDKIIDHRYIAETTAPSEVKARSQLIWRYKQMHGYSNRARIDLSNKVIRRPQ